jgi:hypothetical protein
VVFDEEMFKKMKRTTVVLQFVVGVCAAMLLCFSVTQAQDVRYNYVPGTDFSKYKTYKWVDVPGAEKPDQILDGQIKAAIDSQLTTKGLTKTDGETADLYVTYQLAIQQQRQWNAYGMGGVGWRVGGMGSATATSTTINIGTLVLDLYDVAAKQQVWTGNATKQLNPSKDPQKNMQNLQKAMAKLLKNYPPPKS